jgi:hypothetical protein
MVDLQMNITLALRALALLAFVAASTAVIVQPELIGGPRAPQTHHAVVAFAHG